MNPQPVTITREMIDCIADAREPSEAELARVAGHIWADLQEGRSAFSWDDLNEDNAGKLLTLRAARAALTGAGPDR